MRSARRGTRRQLSPRRSETGAFASQKDRLQRLSGGKIAPKPDKVTVFLATQLHNFPDRESFLPGRRFFMVPPFPAPLVRKVRHAGTQACRAQSLHERHAPTSRRRCGWRGSVGVQVCRRTAFPACANERRSKASARTSVGGHARPIRLVNGAAGATSDGAGIHY
jgi:hypothetical protein